MHRCTSCHRPITNPVSLKHGMGPNCLKRAAQTDTRTGDLFEALRADAIEDLKKAADNCRSLGVTITLTIT